MFALALAVGLTPQLLPAIITINLSHGARRMGAGESDRETAGCDRKLRQHECALREQDGHDYRRQGAKEHATSSTSHASRLKNNGAGLVARVAGSLLWPIARAVLNMFADSRPVMQTLQQSRRRFV